METVKGYIDHYIYEKEAFKIALLQMGKTTLVCKGNMPGIFEGDQVEITGEYVEDARYGRQLKVETIVSIEPDSISDIERYLGSGIISGIGPKKAATIVAAFGEKTLEIMEKEPERLAEIKGISLRQARNIGEEVYEKKGKQKQMLFLQKYKMGPKLSAKILEKFPSGLEEVFTLNPYRLVDEVEGIGFKRADEIAQIAGVPMDSEYRIYSGIIYALKEVSNEGHCCYPKDLLLDQIAEILKLPKDYVENYLIRLSMEDKPRIRIEKDMVSLSSFYYEEFYTAKRLLELNLSYQATPELNRPGFFEEQMKRVSENTGILLDEFQTEGVRKCMDNGVFILSGGPGTGKTTTISAILHFLELMHLSFVLAAPTGRAAKRMTETTGYESSTIHRLLELSGSEDHLAFQRNEENPLECDVVIVDEVSMVDIHILTALLKAMVPGMKLILIGDKDQLSSVGPGQVLADILESKAFTSVILEKIYRQTGEASHIVENAHKINRGEEIDFSQKYPDFFLLNRINPEEIYANIVELQKTLIPKQFGVGVLDTCVLAPKRKGPLGVETLNEVLQARLNPASKEKTEITYMDKTFRVGDRVMQIKNNYDIAWEVRGNKGISIDEGEGIFNGDLGIIMEINLYMRLVTVKFDDDRVAEYTYDGLSELELAYALTIHKSQGGQYPAVIIPLLEKAGNSGMRAEFLNKNLFYTGVTRAKQSVILIGQPECFNSMILAGEGAKRYTNLKKRIEEMNALC